MHWIGFATLKALLQSCRNGCKVFRTHWSVTWILPTEVTWRSLSQAKHFSILQFVTAMFLFQSQWLTRPSLSAMRCQWQRHMFLHLSNKVQRSACISFDSKGWSHGAGCACAKSHWLREDLHFLLHFFFWDVASQARFMRKNNLVICCCLGVAHVKWTQCVCVHAKVRWQSITSNMSRLSMRCHQLCWNAAAWDLLWHRFNDHQEEWVSDEKEGVNDKKWMRQWPVKAARSKTLLYIRKLD